MTDDRPMIVHPEFALERRDLEDFYGEFGPYNGRYVPRYPKTWVQDCIRHLQEIELTPLERVRVMERARQQLAHCTIPGKDKWLTTTDWTDNVKSIQSIQPNTLVVGNGLDPAPFKGWADCVSEVRDSRKRSWSYRGTIREYIEYSSPLLLNAPAGYLIDPYLDPLANEVTNLIYSLFDLIKGSMCYEIHLITRKQECGKKAISSKGEKSPSLEQIANELRILYTDRVGRNRKFFVHLFERTPSETESLRLHDRFLLTKFGAINFGRGFVLDYKQLDQETAYVVDKGLHEKLKSWFIDGMVRRNEKFPLRKGSPVLSSFTTLAVAG